MSNPSFYSFEEAQFRKAFWVPLTLSCQNNLFFSRLSFFVLYSFCRESNLKKDNWKKNYIWTYSIFVNRWPHAISYVYLALPHYTEQLWPMDKENYLHQWDCTSNTANKLLDRPHLLNKLSSKIIEFLLKLNLGFIFVCRRVCKVIILSKKVFNYYLHNGAVLKSKVTSPVWPNSQRASFDPLFKITSVRPVITQSHPRRKI